MIYGGKVISSFIAGHFVDELRIEAAIPSSRGSLGRSVGNNQSHPVNELPSANYRFFGARSGSLTACCA